MEKRRDNITRKKNMKEPGRGRIKGPRPAVVRLKGRHIYSFHKYMSPSDAPRR